MATIGQILSNYRVVKKLGQGGMGEVYQATDLKLGRDVAIKVLPEGFAADADRVARFRREAKLLAALNHTNIAAIYGLEASGETNFLVLELVEGETLADRIKLGPVPVEESLKLATQIATALEAAHKKGIIHRDLKPSNIMLTEGSVKLLDFGLAKAMEGEATEKDGADSPTLTMAATEAGVILGTAAYMSPEQAQGQRADARSDIFSFGLVLYEMLSGRRAFGGANLLATMAALVKDESPKLQTTPSLAKIVQRCLAKQPSSRFQKMSEVKTALERAFEEKTSESSGKPQPSIAVLAFADMSAGKDHEWFCDGIAEEILNALSPLKGLRVAARTSAFSFKGKSDDLRTIGEKLNVTTVLEGSVRRAGDRVRITVQLNDVSSGFQLWSERYDRELKDIFDVQDEIAKAIAERLRVTLAGGKDERLVEQATTNVEAYQLYLKGRALLNRRGGSIPPALDLFRQAVGLDPGYSLAWAGIADAITGLALTGSVRGSESKSQAMAAARRSIEFDSTSAAGHAALACAALLYENNRAVAKQEFERALELGPNYVLGRCWYGLFYFQWARGEFERGIAEARRALESDPLSAYVMMILAACLHTAG
jgi:serine/threonine protein kinase